MYCFVGGGIACDALEIIIAERSFNLANLCHYSRYALVLFHNNLADYIPERHLCITKVHMYNLTNYFKASWDFYPAWKKLFENFLKAKVFIC